MNEYDPDAPSLPPDSESPDTRARPREPHAVPAGAPVQPVPVPIVPGAVLGGFRLVKPIGAGGMGEVWMAQDDRLERPVALKTMRRNLADNDEAVARFQREARAVARLSHPGIVHIYAIGDEGGHLFFAMEYVEGSTLSELIAGGLDPGRAVDLTMQVAEALGYALASGVAHRDIKPGNILIDRSGRARLADFGLAKFLEGADTQMTMAGSVMGSPAYMPPEAAKGEPTDHRGDVYSLGITFYHMLTGQVPFQAPTSAVVMLKQIQDELPYHPVFQEGVAVPLWSIVRRMTEKSPADRYQDYGHLRRDLAAALHISSTMSSSMAVGPLSASDGSAVLLAEHPSSAGVRPGGLGSTVGMPLAASVLTPLGSAGIRPAGPDANAVGYQVSAFSVNSAPAAATAVSSAGGPGTTWIAVALVALVALVSYLIGSRGSDKPAVAAAAPVAALATPTATPTPSPTPVVAMPPAAPAMAGISDGAGAPGGPGADPRGPYLDRLFPKRYAFREAMAATDAYLKSDTITADQRQTLLQMRPAIAAGAELRASMIEASKAKPGIQVALPGRGAFPLVAVSEAGFLFEEDGARKLVAWENMNPPDMISATLALLGPDSTKSMREVFVALAPAFKPPGGGPGGGHGGEQSGRGGPPGGRGGNRAGAAPPPPAPR